MIFPSFSSALSGAVLSQEVTPIPACTFCVTCKGKAAMSPHSCGLCPGYHGVGFQGKNFPNSQGHEKFLDGESLHFPVRGLSPFTGFSKDIEP